MGTNKLKELRTYKNIQLLGRLFLLSLRLLVTSHTRGYKAAIRSVSDINVETPRKHKADTNKISNYVNMLVFIRRKLGFRETCLTHSLLLCHALRANGVDAKINFGARKISEPKGDELPFTGHCWVTLRTDDNTTNYDILFTYPES